MDETNRMQALMSNEPYKRYIKAVLSRVLVKILDPISLREVEVILSGEPDKKEDSCILDLWTPVEVVYFERNNQIILNEGLIVEYKQSIKTTPSVNVITEEELEAVLAERFFALKSLLDKLTSPAPVLRLLAKAEQMNKPVKTIDAIKSRLAELQRAEYEGK